MSSLLHQRVLQLGGTLVRPLFARAGVRNLSVETITEGAAIGIQSGLTSIGFNIDPTYTIFDPPEEFAVFNTSNKWFEPCVSFTEGGVVGKVPVLLDEKYKTILSKISPELTKVQSGVLKLWVEFKGDDVSTEFLTTAFAVSPNIVLTDYHCVPPATYVYNKKGTRIRAIRSSIRALPNSIMNNEVDFDERGIPLEIIQLSKDLSLDVPIVDPVTNNIWDKGENGVDLAVLKIKDCESNFSSYFYPSTEIMHEDAPLSYIGYPRLITNRHLKRIRAVMEATGATLPFYDGILESDQRAIRLQAIEAAAHACFGYYHSKVISFGRVKKVGNNELAVTNPSTTGTSGSPYISLQDPTLVLGNHLGNGVCLSRGDLAQTPNYNLLMTVNHPEWIVKYVKYVVPTLPSTTDKDKVNSYLKKHAELLKKEKLYTLV